ncbi:hypothetical protein Tco_0164393 [Tanacetum coccineum]
MAMYSASVVEIVVLFCFFDDQLTNLSPRKRESIPDVLLRVSWTTCYGQSMHGTFSDIAYLSDNQIPQLMVPLRLSSFNYTIQKCSFVIHMVDGHVLAGRICNEDSDSLYPCNRYK